METDVIRERQRQVNATERLAGQPKALPESETAQPNFVLKGFMR